MDITIRAYAYVHYYKMCRWIKEKTITGQGDKYRLLTDSYINPLKLASANRMIKSEIYYHEHLATQEKLTIIVGTVSSSAYCLSQQDHDKILGYCMYQKWDCASCKWTHHSRFYTGGLTGSVLFLNYSCLINCLPGFPSCFLPLSVQLLPVFLPAPYN